MSTPTASRLTSLLVTFVRDERGFDLVEYALLSGLIGLTGMVIYSLSTNMATTYNGWNTNAQNKWVPCPPQSSGLSCP